MFEIKSRKYFSDRAFIITTSFPDCFFFRKKFRRWGFPTMKYCIHPIDLSHYSYNFCKVTILRQKKQAYLLIIRFALDMKRASVYYTSFINLCENKCLYL